MVFAGTLFLQNVIHSFEENKKRRNCCCSFLNFRSYGDKYLSLLYIAFCYNSCNNVSWLLCYWPYVFYLWVADSCYTPKKNEYLFEKWSNTTKNVDFVEVDDV